MCLDFAGSRDVDMARKHSAVYVTPIALDSPSNALRYCWCFNPFKYPLQNSLSSRLQ